MYEENARLLLNAVVEQAAWDYIEALCEQHFSELEMDKKRWQYEIDQLEQFFLSDNFNGYTRLDGSWFMSKLKKLVKECNYYMKEITKRRQAN